MQFRHYLCKFLALVRTWYPLTLVAKEMIFELYLGGAMALVLGVYLIYALIHPEKF